jgi:hypothetical protein
MRRLQALEARQAEMRARAVARRCAPRRCLVHSERLVTRTSCARCLRAAKRAAWRRYCEKRIVNEAKREEGGVRWGSSLDPKYWP